uniref:ATP synthase complex subunit 8 n=1 Tax=Anthracoceros coronatus TaxID=1303020 RepID=A0A344AIX4_9AVES|nr:ATP synthase F0 subunit 8 [Anthracoceros coronatus]AWV63564.1 ATP synthase F0 subunit 8 [Anthracoceros coronatus]
MPQLNPNPWFLIMLASWLTYSLIIQPKLLTFLTTNPPTSKMITPTKPLPWPWPWS